MFFSKSISSPALDSCSLYASDGNNVTYKDAPIPLILYTNYPRAHGMYLHRSGTREIDSRHSDKTREIAFLWGLCVKIFIELRVRALLKMII